MNREIKFRAWCESNIEVIGNIFETPELLNP